MDLRKKIEISVATVCILSTVVILSLAYTTNEHKADVVSTVFQMRVMCSAEQIEHLPPVLKEAVLSKQEDFSLIETWQLHGILKQGVMVDNKEWKVE